MNGGTWLLLVAFALVAAANWWSRVRLHTRLEVATKPLATVLAGFLCAVHGAGGPVTAYALIGFGLCLLGDVFLLPQIDQFVLGLAAFLLGHVAFIVACLVHGADASGLGLLAVAAIVVVMLTVGRGVLDGARRTEPALYGPVFAYLIVIGVMFVFAAGTGSAAALVGAAFFVTSDSVLGWGKFVREQEWTDVAIMVTYHLALGGVALGL